MIETVSNSSLQHAKSVGGLLDSICSSYSFIISRTSVYRSCSKQS